MAVSTYDAVEEKRCPYCGSTSLRYDYEEGEIVCEKCGYVVRDVVVDRGREVRAFTLEEQEEKIRTGPPVRPYLPDKGLPTEMGVPEKDVFGSPLPPEVRRQMKRLRKWNERIKPYPSEARKLNQAMAVLDKFCDKLSLPTYVKERAANIYREALRKGLVRGRSIVSMVAASLYAACRVLGVPVRLKRIAEISVVAYDERGEAKALEVAKKEVSRCYRLILKEVGLPIKIADPKIYVQGIVEKARLPTKVAEIARDIIERAREARIIAGKDPLGVAAAATYVACVMIGERRTQKEIAKAAGVTEVTIRNRYKELREKLKLEIPE